MTQPAWMQGEPVDDSNTPAWMQGEVIDEGGPKRNSVFGVGVPASQEEAEALGEADRRRRDEEAFVKIFDRPDREMKVAEKVAAYGDNLLNSATFGNAANINTFLSHDLGIGAPGAHPGREAAKEREQAFRTQLREKHPVSAIAGDITGYALPGLALYKGAAAAGRMVPGAAATTNAIAQSGRVPAYLQRLLGSTAAVTADLGVYGATVDAANTADALQRDVTGVDRMQGAQDMATARIPGTPVPMAALPVVGSVAERTLKGITTRGKQITPDRVAAQSLEQFGRTPNASSTAREMRNVLDGERVTGSSIKTFRFIENALRNSGASTNRIRDGFNRIHEALPTVADGRTPLTMLIEREFAKDLGPAVAENLRKFLLKVGMDDPAVTRGFIDDMRQTQVDDFRGLVDENLGARLPDVDGAPGGFQPATDFENTLQQGIAKKSKERQKVLDFAKKNANDSPLSHSVREHLLDNSFKGQLTGEALKRGWKDVDTFINQDPWNAANRLQMNLQPLRESARASGNLEALTKADETIAFLQDFLGRTDKTGLPGYNRFNSQIAAEARVRDNLGYTDQFGKTHPGFGPDLKKAARSERQTEQMVKRYAGETPLDQTVMGRLPSSARGAHLERSQSAARVSTGEVLKDQLRGARPGGVNAAGQDVVGLRLSDLQTAGMMDAMKSTFGKPGENVADGINSIVNRRQFLADIDPKTGSNTANKLEAMAHGDEVFSGGLGRSLPTNATSNSALMDVLMFANGIPPVATLLKKAPGWMQAPFRPSMKQRQHVAESLLHLPKRPGGPPPTKPALKPLTGHSNPKWKGDKRWDHKVLSDPKLSGLEVNPVTGAVIGGSIASDYDGDGRVSWKERLLMAGGGAMLGSKMRTGGGKGGPPRGGGGPKQAGFDPSTPIAAAGRWMQRSMASKTDPRRMLPLLDEAGVKPETGRPALATAERPELITRELAAQAGHPKDFAKFQADTIRDDNRFVRETARRQAAEGTPAAMMKAYKQNLASINAGYKSGSHTKPMDLEKQLISVVGRLPGMRNARGQHTEKAWDLVYRHAEQIRNGRVRAASQNQFKWGAPPSVLPRRYDRNAAVMLDVDQQRVSQLPRRPKPRSEMTDFAGTVDPKTGDEFRDLMLNPARADDAAEIMQNGRTFDSFNKTGKVVGGTAVTGGILGSLLASDHEGPGEPQYEASPDLVPNYGMKDYQRFLNAAGYSGNTRYLDTIGQRLTEDGREGPNTRLVLMHFQSVNDLPETGKLDAQTQRTLEIKMLEAQARRLGVELKTE